MTEEDYYAEISAQAKEGRDIPVEFYSRIEAALAAFPRSPRLWCLRGDLIQLGTEDNSYPLEEILASYEKALNIDPTFAKAHESIGYYFDVLDEDLPRSREAFTHAIKLGGGPHSYAGLARVLTELGESRSSVLALLDRCPFPDSKIIEEIRGEIERGEWVPESG